LEQKVADFIRAERLFAGDKRILLAVSGGADSTALLYIMTSLKTRGVMPAEIYCAHINHRLRGAESQRDQNFVESQCRKLKLPLFTKEIDVRQYAHECKLSIETAARKLRIGALMEIAQQQNCSCVATAHQENDNAETVLQRLIRGTGFRGLCGILPVKEFGAIRFVRPLLCSSKDEILRYLQAEGLQWCTDRTNEDCLYRRNFIRHKLLPFFQKDCTDNLVGRLTQLTELSRGFYRLISSVADEIWPDVATLESTTAKLNLPYFDKQHLEVKIEIIRRILTCLDAGQQDFTERHYQKLMKLPDCEKVQLPGNIEAHRQGGTIIFSSHQSSECRAALTPPKRLLIPGTTEFAGNIIEGEVFDYNEAKFRRFRASKNNTVEWLDFDKLKLPLKVRFRKTGDRFWPLGLKAEKKIGKFLTDEKIPQKNRRKLLVIEDTEKIIWLCSARSSELTKITRRTKRVLQLWVAGISRIKEGAAKI
jgi:tRNA(Ile)-lysidine synthase